MNISDIKEYEKMVVEVGENTWYGGQPTDYYFVTSDNDVVHLGSETVEPYHEYFTTQEYVEINGNLGISNYDDRSAISQFLFDYLKDKEFEITTEKPIIKAKDIPINFSKRQIGKSFTYTNARTGKDVTLCRVYFPNSSQYKGFHILCNPQYIHEASEKSCYTYLNPDYPVTVSDSKNEAHFKLTAEQVKEEFNSYKNKEKETVKDNIENDFELEK